MRRRRRGGGVHRAKKNRGDEDPGAGRWRSHRGPGAGKSRSPGGPGAERSKSQGDPGAGRWRNPGGPGAEKQRCHGDPGAGIERTRTKGERKTFGIIATTRPPHLHPKPRAERSPGKTRPDLQRDVAPCRRLLLTGPEGAESGALILHHTRETERKTGESGGMVACLLHPKQSAEERNTPPGSLLHPTPALLLLRWRRGRSRGREAGSAARITKLAPLEARPRVQGHR